MNHLEPNSIGLGIQHHIECNAGYCLRLKDGYQKYRFNFSQEQFNVTYLQYEKIKSKTMIVIAGLL